MIYTGYFAKTKKYIEAGLTPISIAGRAPSFYDGIEYKKLAPKYALFAAYKSGELNEFQYAEGFKELTLDPLSQKQVEEELYELSNGNDVVLLCYEKQGDFCHRHLVADWLENAFIRVDEYNE